MRERDSKNSKDHRQPPDILLIYTDQWRWDALGSIGSPARTPALDLLAEQGVHFDHAIVQAPVCMPSRASMLTGLYPSELGITEMGIPVPENTETISRILRRRGYRTANIGKLHFQTHANRDYTMPHPNYGFDILALSDEPGPYEDDYRAWVRAEDPSSLPLISPGLPPMAARWQELMQVDSGIRHPTSGGRSDYADVAVFPADESLTHTAWVGTRTIEHLDSLPANLPAFTVAGFYSPHAPYRVPKRFLELYDPQGLPLPDLSETEKQEGRRRGLSEDHIRAVRHGYYAAISEVDFHVGRILKHLEHVGRADRTIVVFTADHGEWLGDHLRFGKGYPADDPVSRVPLILRWPEGIVSPGRRVGHIVEAVDIVPTLLECARIPVPSNLHGFSLREALLGGDPPRPEIGVTEFTGWRSVRTPKWRYLAHADGSERLWDLHKDPYGHNDIAADPSYCSVLAEHRLALLKRMLQSGQRLQRTWPY